MAISKIVIHNFKCFREFKLELNTGLNILVGDNEVGKSTILEAIHLALTGIYSGRSIRNEVSSYLFNKDAVSEYLESLKTKKPILPPTLSIEIFFNGSIDVNFEGNLNSDGASKVEGFKFEIIYSNQYDDEYGKLVKTNQIVSLPIEYYVEKWTSFARKEITTRSVPFKSVLIDSSNYRYQNGSDVFITRIVKDLLDSEEIISIIQAYRKMVDNFSDEDAIKNINSRISQESTIVDDDISISPDYGTKNSWENSLITQVSGIPFSFIGKGAQCIIKTELALSNKKTQDATIILLEEPESHISYTKLNQLISSIENKYSGKQILISTHSSFVANKLGLNNLILLNDMHTVKLKDIKSADFFKKMSGYDTLRLILCKKAILVEGDSDELVVQRAYMDTHNGRLPIQDGIDVITVGLSFLRFLEVATILEKKTVVVSDNDGDIDAIESKYSDYLGDNKKEFIDICIDMTVDTGNLKIGNKNYNYNTLEPKLLYVNSRKTFNKIFETSFKTDDELRKYMKEHKTECALAIFESEIKITYPQYIMEAVSDE